jgi:hypothetical protein
MGGQTVLGRPAMLAAAGGAAVTILALVAFLAWRNGQQGPAPGSEQAGAAGPAPAQTAQPSSPATAGDTSQPGPAADAKPAPVTPALTLSSVTAALSGVPCSALAPVLQEHQVRVEGFLPRSYGQARLQSLLSALPGAARIDLSVQEVDDSKCALLAALGPYWTAHRMAGGGGALRLKHGGNALTQGEPLVVNITTPAYQSWVAVDYFELDGSVVHLLPNLRTRDNVKSASQSVTIGQGGDWLISPPFGNEMLVLVATPVPLFDGLRPESEPAADYTPALQKELARISRAQGPARVAVDFVMMTTRARR